MSADATPLHIVFLQGMPSPFFSRIGAELATRGHRATAINLCIGDQLFWRGPNTVNYRGRFSGWPAFLAHYFGKHHVTDLVLLGEQRRYHKEAVAVAQACGVRVTVTDFGYLRPNWLTLERNGMSGNSLFPKDEKTILQLAAAAPEIDWTPLYRDDFWTMARGDLLYSFSNVFLGWLYPFYQRSDRRAHPLIYFPAMALRMFGTRTREARTHVALSNLYGSKARFFIFPLQLEHDFQIQAYSRFHDLDEPIRQVLTSFASHADKDMHLLVKSHPWDPGFKHWPTLIARQAEAFGIGERVHCIETGSLDDAMKACAGMVTINSTSGIRALQLGLPVKTLGQAIYDIEGLAFQGPLDRFWTEAKPASAGFIHAFMKAIAATIQIRGVFFNEPGLSVAVHEATERLITQHVGMLS